MLTRISGISLAALLALALWSAPAAAEPPSAAVRLYSQGEFVAAADRAEAQPSSTSLAFAARALMAACVTTPDAAHLDDWLDRAETASREALTLDPDSVEARLQWALALGVRGRRASMAEAVARNYAPRGRRLIVEALSREPDNAWAHALLGAWHLEVIRRGGRTGARLYGARLETGISEFERARALAPNDAMIALHFAIALIELDAQRYRDRAEDLLATAATHTPRDALETHTLAAAHDVAVALTTRGPRAAQAVARAAFL
jgi:tetratricopeptide (TPR) repeat protein